VSTPDDRIALGDSQAVWAHSKQAPMAAPEDTRTHQQELQIAHEGRPTVAQQSKDNGCGLPAVDKGPTPGTVVG
jgi:hypothetical protein